MLYQSFSDSSSFNRKMDYPYSNYPGPGYRPAYNDRMHPPRGPGGPYPPPSYYPCTFCGSSFDSEMRLRVHVERFCTYTGSNPPPPPTAHMSHAPMYHHPVPVPVYHHPPRYSQPPVYHPAPPPSLPPRDLQHSTQSHHSRNYQPQPSQASNPMKGVRDPAAPESTPMLYFSGQLQPGSLTGGCGWWILNEKKVVAHGGAPVHQTFPSVLGLEYEGLLNGLQAAIRKGVKRILIKASSDFILTNLSHPKVNQPPGNLTTTHHEHSSIKIAVEQALKNFSGFDLELCEYEPNFPTIRFAKKAINDYNRSRYVQVMKSSTESPENSVHEGDDQQQQQQQQLTSTSGKSIQESTRDSLDAINQTSTSNSVLTTFPTDSLYTLPSTTATNPYKFDFDMNHLSLGGGGGLGDSFTKTSSTFSKE